MFYKSEKTPRNRLGGHQDYTCVIRCRVCVIEDTGEVRHLSIYIMKNKQYNYQ